MCIRDRNRAGVPDILRYSLKPPSPVGCWTRWEWKPSPAGNHISVFQTTKQTPLFLNTAFILYMTQYIPFIPGYQYPLYNLHKKPCTNMVVLTKIKFLYSFYFRYSGGKTIENHQSPEYKCGGDTGPQRPSRAG